MQPRPLSYDQKALEVCQDSFARASSLREALQGCSGLFPIAAISHFREIDPTRTVQWIDEALSSIEGSPEKSQESFFLSTWRFDTSEMSWIDYCPIRESKRTCLLGAPSLRKYLASNKAATHVIIDAGSDDWSIPNRAIHLAKDINVLGGHELSGAFDFCFLDPPWYLPHFFKWIDVAGQYCREGGSIAFSLLGELTRPSANEDRAKILSHCEERGLSTRVYKNAILYEVPSFERAMLLRKGIAPVPWKRADLVVATKTAWRASAMHTTPEPLGVYQQILVQGVLVDVIIDRHVAQCDKMISPTDHYWMETPSRRTYDLKSCNVFTSNGGKLCSPRPLDLYICLKNLNLLPYEEQLNELNRMGWPPDLFSSPRISRKRPQKIA